MELQYSSDIVAMSMLIRYSLVGGLSCLVFGDILFTF